MQHDEEVDDVAWIYNGQEKVPPTVRRVKIAETVARIPDETFYEHQGLEGVILSSSVQVIGKKAFYLCKKLKSILFQGQEKEEVGIPSNVKEIDDEAFEYCTLLARLGLNEGLERIGKGAFYQCVYLRRMEIPSTVNVIESHAFHACKLLKRLGLNEGLERIGDEAFTACYSLSHVRIPRSVYSIAARAFVQCRSLISIELPEECSFDIELSGCRSLVSVAGRISIFSREVDRDEFFQSSKLGSLVDNEDDLIRRLNHRFDNSPLNQLCYYQSYHSYEDAMAQLRWQQQRKWMNSQSGYATGRDGCRQARSYGSCQGLIGMHCDGLFIFESDANFERGDSKTLPNSFLPNAGLGPAIDEALEGDWGFRKSKIGGVVRRYERKEIISLLELCLWKGKIDEATPKKVKIGEATSKKEQILADRQRCRVMSGAAVAIPQIGEATSKKEQILVDRQRCRVMSGVAVVIPHVLPFLDS
eukprot:scaffold6322_cov59-Cylindrotheca_fusiformis.AAC.20